MGFTTDAEGEKSQKDEVKNSVALKGKDRKRHRHRHGSEMEDRAWLWDT